jgi:Zn-finger nucleic acid-binding protein
MESSGHVRICSRIEVNLRTMMREVVELRHIPVCAVGVTRVWQTRGRVPQLVEKGVHHGVDC